MSFNQAVAALIDNKRITKLEWDNNDYCVLKDGWLQISRNGVLHQWLINDGDLLGTDWVVVPEEQK